MKKVRLWLKRYRISKRMSQKESAVMETTYLLRKKPRNSENEKDIDSEELHKTMEEELRQRLNQKSSTTLCFLCAKLNFEEPLMGSRRSMPELYNWQPWSGYELAEPHGEDAEILQQLMGYPAQVTDIDISKDMECPLCRAIQDCAKILAGDLDQNEGVFELQWEYWGGVNTRHKYEEYEDNFPGALVFSIVWPATETGFKTERIGRFLIRISSPNEFNDRKVGRELLPIVDFKYVAGWLEITDEKLSPNHDLGTRPVATRYYEDFRLIDVRQQCITSGTATSRYAALSYVWGGSSQYKLTMERVVGPEKPGSLLVITEQLPKVVKDAMIVCDEMKIPYLWVDALCIVQDDYAGKMSQIRHMNRIYSSAYVTLVAAAGNDAADGLPRVSISSPQDIRQFRLNGTSYVVSECDPSAAVLRSR
jgi:hypothetical protein